MYRKIIAYLASSEQYGKVRRYLQARRLGPSFPKLKKIYKQKAMTRNGYSER